MELRIKDIEVDCVIGERPDERVRLQRLLVTAALTVADKAAQSDELADAVDYVAVATRIRQTLVEAQCRLVERAAHLAAQTCLAFAGVEAAEVAVAKSGAVPGLASVCAVATARRGAGGERGEEAAGCPKRKPWWRF